MQTCRLCGHPVFPFLTLGRVPLPEEFRKKSECADPITTYPLGLSSCGTCLHVQLTNPIAQNRIYKQHYFYDYSVTSTGSDHWNRLAHRIIKTCAPHDLVVDVGSNTGALLSRIQKRGIRVLGVDPAKQQVRIARAANIPSWNAYFSPAIAKKIVHKYGQAHVITCTNVFDHVADLSHITRAFRMLLQHDGVLIIEVPYFYRMLKEHSHIPYHQQIDYMLLTQLVPFFKKHKLHLIDAREIPLHGGSIRMCIAHTGVQSLRLRRLLSREQRLLATYPDALTHFAKTYIVSRNTFSRRIRALKAQGKTIVGVGASAKGITFLHYCNLGPHEIMYITEKSPMKIGRYTATGIPVVEDQRIIADQPDYSILLAWNFAREIRHNVRGYHGRWIIPIPKIHVTS